MQKQEFAAVFGREKRVVFDVGGEKRAWLPLGHGWDSPTANPKPTVQKTPEEIAELNAVFNAARAARRAALGEDKPLQATLPSGNSGKNQPNIVSTGALVRETRNVPPPRTVTAISVGVREKIGGLGNRTGDAVKSNNANSSSSTEQVFRWEALPPEKVDPAFLRFVNGISHQSHSVQTSNAGGLDTQRSSDIAVQSGMEILAQSIEMLREHMKVQNAFFQERARKRSNGTL